MRQKMNAGFLDILVYIKKTFTFAEAFQNIKLDGKLSVKRPFVNYTKNLVIEKLLMWLSTRYKR